MENPFIFGPIVEGRVFTDRKEEKKDLLQSLKGGQNIILFAPRRFGKSSLMKEVSLTLKKEGLLSIWIDLSECPSIKVLCQKMIREIYSISKVAGISRFLKEALPAFLSYFKVGVGVLEISIDHLRAGEDKELLSQLFDILEKIGKNRKKRVVCILDEFQDITLLEKNLDKYIRGRIQHHKNAAYVFMGSKRSLIQELFFKKSRPLYHIGKKVEIGLISKEAFEDFIKERFAFSKKKIKDEAIQIILKLTEGHPYFTQYLCHELWNVCEEEAGEKEAEYAITRCINHQIYTYDTMLDETRSRAHRSVLFYLAQYGSRDIFGAAALTEMSLLSANSVNQALKSFLKREIILKNGGGSYHFLDPFFKLYLLQKLQG